KLLVSIFLIFFVLFFCADFVLAEEITITTYYPSPYGSYNSLQTDKLGVGDNNAEGAWTSADVPTTSGEAWIKGNVGIGTSTLVPLTAKLTVVTNNNEDSLWYSYNNGNSYDFDFIVNRARGTSEAPLAVSSANNLGSIRFHGYDGASFIEGAEMEASVDGTPGSNDMPAKLIFGTTPDGASGPISRMVIKNDGKIGIGTLDPKGKLHIQQDDLAINWASEVNWGMGGYAIIEGDDASLSLISNNGSYSASSVKLAEVNGAGSYRNVWALWRETNTAPGTGVGSFHISYADTTTAFWHEPEMFTIKPDGFVGIGTAAPNAPLHVFSSTGVGPEIRVQSTEPTRSADLHVQSDGREWAFGSAGSADSIGRANKFFIYDETARENRLIIDTTGNVGIRTNTPTESLHIYGDATIRLEGDTDPNHYADMHFDNTNAGGREYVVGNYGSAYSTASLRNAFFIRDNSGGGDRFIIQPNGNVGIGTANPGAFKMYIGGTGFLDAASWTYGSDKRLKENINYIQSGLSIIKQLKPARFDYIKGDKKQAGFIAQEVEAVLPDIITKGEDGMLGMKTESIIPYLVKAIQEQQEEINILKVKLNAQK
ncbi:MAG: tail fiber domain-containing protein, partial [Candidatus Omnitrophota bacterium]